MMRARRASHDAARAGRAARANAWLRARARGEENAVNRALERHHAMRGFRTPTIERSRLEAIEGG